MIWILNYLTKFVTELLRFINVFVPQKFLNFIAPSFMEDSGKASGKRISAAFFSAIVAYIIVYVLWVDEKLTQIVSDFCIYVIISLLTYIALCFGMTYIPSRTSKSTKDEKTDGTSYPERSTN